MQDKVKTDIILKDFWRSNERFADLMNAVLFDGEEVVLPEMLEERDTDLSGTIQMKDHKESLGRIRDVVRKSAYGTDFVILGIENQMHIHYAMPLRQLLYDGMGYLKEYQQIVRSYKEEREKMTEAEFLSKMKKEDRLHPILSVVVYYGEDEWDGPLCLRDMMIDVPEEIGAMFSDYSMHLLQVRESDRFVFKNEDVRTVFDISRDILRKRFDTIRENYQNVEIDSELISVIGKITSSKFLMGWNKKEGKDSMCRALDELEQRGVEKGITSKVKELILKWTAKGLAVPEIADLLELSEDMVQSVQAGQEVLLFL